MKKLLLLSILLSGCNLPDKPTQPEKKEPSKKVEPVKEEPQPIRVLPDDSVLATKKREQEELAKKQQEAEELKRKQQEELITQQKAVEEAQRIEQERLKKEADETLTKRYVCFIDTSNKMIQTFETILPKLKYEIVKIEDQITEINKQATGRKNKINELNRQIEYNKELLSVLPKENRGMICPNLMCGKYSGTDSMVSTCPYCGATLHKKASNTQRQEINNKILLLNKSLQFEEQNLNNISTEALDSKLQYYKTSQTNLINTINTLKQTKELPEEEGKKGIEKLEQLLETYKNLSETFKEFVPNFKEPTTTIVKNEPAAPKKVYKLTNGQTIEVNNEIITNNEIIIKTIEGKMITINKKDIVQ